MKLSNDQTSLEGLTMLGREAVALLSAGNLAGLAARFGYALAYGRDPEIALRADLNQHLSRESSEWSGDEVQVKYFKPDRTNLFAVVECRCRVSNRLVPMQLIVSVKGDEKHVMIEGIG
jgi:hypothetical protein